MATGERSARVRSINRHARLIDDLLLHGEYVEHATRCTVGPFWVAIFGVLARPFYIRDAVLARTNRRVIVAYIRGSGDGFRVDKARARSAPVGSARRARTRRFRGRSACDILWPNGARTMLAFTKRHAGVAAQVLEALPST